jgi:hypothetical protein
VYTKASKMRMCNLHHMFEWSLKLFAFYKARKVFISTMQSLKKLVLND